jgi:hypothetical protein
MANRNFSRRQALEKEVKDLYLKVAIGSSGAPTLTTGYGISSISRTSQGLYRITLADAYVSLKSFRVIQIASSAEDLTFQIKAEDVASAKTIDFFTLAAGSVADPSSGSSLLIKIEVKNTDQI